MSLNGENLTVSSLPKKKKKGAACASVGPGTDLIDEKTEASPLNLKKKFSAREEREKGKEQDRRIQRDQKMGGRCHHQKQPESSIDDIFRDSAYETVLEYL